VPFAADESDGVLRITSACAIPLSELEWRFGPSGGPGGQHANRSNTRADLRFDAAGSPSLGPRQRERIVAALGAVVRVSVDDERSQTRNRALALERLRERLAGALHVERPRRPTKPSAGARQNRLDAKRHRAEVKRARGRVDPE
jgi:ribosome-associated protein